jgi:hypothetical protein
MRIVNVIYGIASSIMFIGCVVGEESVTGNTDADTETADTVEPDGSSIVTTAARSDMPGAAINPYDCPPSWPSCGPEPGMQASAK